MTINYPLSSLHVIKCVWSIQCCWNSLKYKLERNNFEISSCMTRAVSSPTSDPGKKPCLAASCLQAAGLLCPTFHNSRVLMFSGTYMVALFWQRFCEEPARLSMPISIPSQITGDCKSVSFYTRMLYRGIFFQVPLQLKQWLALMCFEKNMQRLSKFVPIHSGRK